MGFLPIKPILPINPIHAQDTNRVLLHVDGSTFFIDNEYFGDRISGYTSTIGELATILPQRPMEPTHCMTAFRAPCISFRGYKPKYNSRHR